jgi:hypothetical protein
MTKEVNVMPVTIGTVTTFPHPKADKAQVLKIAEEEHEIFSAWEDYNECAHNNGDDRCSECDYKDCCSLEEFIVSEIADTIQACANLAAAIGVDDMRGAMKACEERNRERGRL